MFTYTQNYTKFYSDISNFEKQNLTRWCKMCRSNAPGVKNLILQIQDSVRPIRLKDLLCIIMRYRDFTIFKTAAAILDC